MNAKRTLLLMRHGKSAYPPGVADHERPLAARGTREARLAGDWLRSSAPPVDAVLCSTSRRTRQTLECTGIDAPVKYVERLYAADPRAVLEELNGVSKKVATLLVVGHEPTTSAVAVGLSGAPGTDANAVAQLSTKFPTSAIAVLTFDGPWRDLALGGAALVGFHVPR